MTVEARDNDAVSGPKWGKSAAILVILPQVGEPEALRYQALLKARDAVTDLLAFRLGDAGKPGAAVKAADAAAKTKATERFAREAEEQAKAVKAVEDALAGTYGGLTLRGRIVSLARGQLRRLATALDAAKKSGAASGEAYQKLVDETESALLAIDVGVRTLGVRDTRTVAKRLADVADESAEAAALARSGRRRKCRPRPGSTRRWRCSAAARCSSCGSAISGSISGDRAERSAAHRPRSRGRRSAPRRARGARSRGAAARAGSLVLGRRRQGRGGVGRAAFARAERRRGLGCGRGGRAGGARARGPRARSLGADGRGGGRAPEVGLARGDRRAEGRGQASRGGHPRGGEAGCRSRAATLDRRRTRRRPGARRPSRWPPRSSGPSSATRWRAGRRRRRRSRTPSGSATSRISSRRSSAPVARRGGARGARARAGLGRGRSGEAAPRLVGQRQGGPREGRQGEQRLAERARDLGKKGESGDRSLPQEMLDRLGEAEQSMRDAEKALQEGDGDCGSRHQQEAQRLLEMARDQQSEDGEGEGGARAARRSWRRRRMSGRRRAQEPGGLPAPGDRGPQGPIRSFAARGGEALRGGPAQVKTTRSSASRASLR